MQNETTPTTASKSVEIFDRAKMILGQAMKTTGAKMVVIGDKLAKTTAPDAVYESLEPKTTMGSGLNAETMADSLIKYVAINYDVVNKALIRSPAFREVITKLMEGQLK